MPAPKKNQFWKLRSRHGRKRLFASAKLLWEAAEEYFAWADKTPWHKTEAIRSGENAGDIIKIQVRGVVSL